MNTTPPASRNGLQMNGDVLFATAMLSIRISDSYENLPYIDVAKYSHSTKF
jgi:hypothetical protein